MVCSGILTEMLNLQPFLSCVEGVSGGRGTRVTFIGSPVPVEQSELGPCSGLRCLTPPGLPLVSGPVRGFHGQDLEV